MSEINHPPEWPAKAHPDMMTVEDVARRLNVSDSFVYGAVADGRLKHHRLGKGQGGIRISESQLSAFLAGTERGGDAAKEEVLKPAEVASPVPRVKGQKIELW